MPRALSRPHVSRQYRRFGRLAWMATTRTRRRSPAVRALRWLWTLALSLLFIVVGLVLAGGGIIFAVVGVQAILEPDDAGHAVAGVLFAVLGLAAAGGGVLTIFRLRSRAVLKLSGRRPPSLGGGGFFGGFPGDGGGGCGGDGGGGGGSC